MLQNTISPIRPDYKPHVGLESSASAYIESKGYFVFQQTYHTVLPLAIIDLLKTNYLVSSLYIRSRADRIAISKERQFEFEVKTHANPNYKDLTIEVLPFLMHYAKRMFIDCMYICGLNNKEFGFWVSSPPKVREINLPPVPKNEHVKNLVLLYRDCPAFHGAIWKTKITGGSNDPYLIIDHSEIAPLQDWRALL